MGQITSVETGKSMALMPPMASVPEPVPQHQMVAGGAPKQGVPPPQVLRGGFPGQEQGHTIPGLQTAPLQQVGNIQGQGTQLGARGHGQGDPAMGYRAAKLGALGRWGSAQYCQTHTSSVPSMDPVLRAMWPDGEQSITEVTKRPLTAATLFKNSIVALVENLASKVLAFGQSCMSPSQPLVTQC